MFKIFNKKDALSQKKSSLGDLITIITSTPQSLIKLENKIIHKPEEDILNEIKLGLNIINLELEPNHSNKKLIIIPPKYEFWTYLLLSIKLAEIGYKVFFIYHNWSKEIVETIKPNLNYLRYQNLIIENGDDFEISPNADHLVLNFSENYNGIKNSISSFSTAIVSETADLDYVMAYILENTFSFAGLKKSNLKRIIVDERIKKEFQNKIHIRLNSIDNLNKAKIKSDKLKQEIHEMVSDSIAEGATLLVGGDNFDEDYYNNIVLDEVSKESRAFQKNFFGPVLLINYSNFETQNLKHIIKQQPSVGIVVFTNDSKFVDFNSVVFENKEFVLRPFDHWKFSIIFENNPSLQKAFKFLNLI